MPSDQFGFSPAAQRDLRMILQLSEERWGSDQSARYAKALDTACRHLASFPDIGTVQTALGEIRTFVVEQHRIFYRRRSADVLILRIIHQRMRLSNLDLT